MRSALTKKTAVPTSALAIIITLAGALAFGCAPSLVDADAHADGLEQELTYRVASLPAAREGHAAALLGDGRVLVIGGNLSVGGSATASTTIYDPVANTWSAGPTMTHAFLNVVAMTLASGKVLAFGDGSTSADLVDVALGTSSSTGALPGTLGYPAAVLLAGGDVLAVGAQYAGTPSMVAYRYSASAGTWSTAAAPPSSLYFDAPAAVRLADGRVLVTSGTTGAIYDASTNAWTSTAAPPHARNRHLLVLLPDGRAAAIGDWSCGESYEKTIDAYNAATDSWSTLTTSSAPHSFGTALMLSDNRTLMLAGGEECPGPTPSSTIEFYDTSLGFFSSSEIMSDARSRLTATMLADGRVLLAGGRGGSGWSNYVSANVDLRVVPAAVSATYSSTYYAPLCAYPATQCSTGTLVNGRGPLGPEPHASNTISTCTDGSYGTYHSDESVDAVRITANGGGALEPNRSVTVDVDVWAWAGYTSDALDLYVAANADAPVWTFVTTKAPTHAGAGTISHTFTLPSSGGAKMAVRAQLRYLGAAAACSGGGYDDHDDVVFGVMAPP